MRPCSRWAGSRTRRRRSSGACSRRTSWERSTARAPPCAASRRAGTATIVNVASIDGRIAAPYASAYAASKHAVVGFSAAIRQELRLERKPRDPALRGPPCDHRHAALPARRELHRRPGQGDAARLSARAGGADHRLARDRPRREALVGTSAHLMSALWALAPAIAEAVIARRVRRRHLDHRHATADSVGNVFGPRGPQARTGAGARRGAGGSGSRSSRSRRRSSRASRGRGRRSERPSTCVACGVLRLRVACGDATLRTNGPMLRTNGPTLGMVRPGRQR